MKTGIEKILVTCSEINVICKKSGILKYKNNKKLVLHEEIKKGKTEISNLFLNKIKNKINIVKYRKYIKRIYFLKEKFQISQKIKITTKKWIKDGNIMIEGLNSKKGILTLGKNVLVCYLSWKGYNFEDAIIINQKLIQKNILTSHNIKKCKIFLLSTNAEEVKLF